MAERTSFFVWVNAHAGMQCDFARFLDRMAVKRNLCRLRRMDLCVPYPEDSHDPS